MIDTAPDARLNINSLYCLSVLFDKAKQLRKLILRSEFLYQIDVEFILMRGLKYFLDGSSYTNPVGYI